MIINICQIFFILSGNMVTSLAWNDSTNMLAALSDSKLTVWFYPSAVYVDRDLLAITLMEKDARLVLGLGSNFV